MTSDALEEARAEYMSGEGYPEAGYPSLSFKEYMELRYAFSSCALSMGQGHVTMPPPFGYLYERNRKR